MSDDFTYTLNGVDLDEALGDGFLSDVTVWRSEITTRRNPVILPGEHGSVNPALPVYEEATVKIGIRVLEDTQTALEERTNHLRALFTQPTMTLGRKSGTAIDTTAKVELVSLGHEDYLVGRTDRIITVLALPKVFFRESPVVSADIAFASNLTNTEIPELSGSSGAIVDSIIRITGPATSVSVTDPGTGTGLSWAGTLAAGQFLFMRARPLMCRISSNADDWLAGGTNVIGQIDYPANGRLQLWPVVSSPTVRKVLVNGTGGGRVSGQTKLAVRAGRSFL